MSIVGTNRLDCSSSLAVTALEFERQIHDEIRIAAYFGWKSSWERILAACMLLPGLPLIGLLVLLVRLTSRGPGIYSQVRMGRNGRTFTMYKIRSMRIDAEYKSGPTWTGQNDPRITPLGRILRKLHLDELPQLFNVLKGEMALIGPRPERPEFVYALLDYVPGYANRLAVLPGVTGLAQIKLPPDSTVDDVRRKVLLDQKYIRDASLGLDLRILGSTLARMLGVPGDMSMRLFRLHHPLPHLPASNTEALGPQELLASEPHHARKRDHRHEAADRVVSSARKPR